MDIYLIFVIVLFGLAVTDLVVGVSNDAVNFLNSAIGSQVASRRIIMLVASLGVFIGATFSGGMMEVARKGIFNPEMFMFADIMAIFLAVMLTDIILLDVFNTLGMPTSTTVSIVFELLGAAVAVALIKVVTAGDSVLSLGSYINSEKATEIILGIFISVGIAFTIGAIVMWLSRLIFSFNYEKRLRFAGALWGGLAFAALSYFLLFKGLKGAAFVSDDFEFWVQENSLMLLGASFLFWTIILQILLRVFKFNIFRAVVLFGTFSLAMAFAGNDLVNFIGVPIAGLESYHSWSASGAAPDAFGMGSLAKAVRTNPFLLFGAGVIMVATLWFSKKARSVTETEVNLGRQDEGSERFRPNFLARILVRIIHELASGISNSLPEKWQKRIGTNFTTRAVASSGSTDVPAFDLVRASVNLTVASALIALATSLKLPLSTTYVSFMVAMGSSLADRAWGRDSAVYRVAGVLNVILGWLMTALIAFTTAALFAWFIHYFDVWAAGLLLLLAVFLISRSFLYHRKKEQEKKANAALPGGADHVDSAFVYEQTNKAMTGMLSRTAGVYEQNINGLIQEDLSQLRSARKASKALVRQNNAFRQSLFQILKSINPASLDAGRRLILAYDLEQDLIGSVSVLASSCHDHVANVHEPLSPGQQNKLKSLMRDVLRYLKHCQQYIEQESKHGVSNLKAEKMTILDRIEALMLKQHEGLISNDYNSRNSLLYFTILLETKDIVAIATRFARL
ncbi:MAG: inorganic phosphate transporter [Bacteroidia bacterium]